MQPVTTTIPRSNQPIVTVKGVKASSAEIKIRLETLYSRELEASGVNLESTEETQVWCHFILDLARQSLTQPGDTPYTSDILAGFSLSSTGQGASVEIKMNGETTIMSDVSLGKLLEKIRIVIAEQDNAYFGNNHIQLVRSVKQRVAFDDIAYGLTCGIGNSELPEARSALFSRHCLLIQDAFIPGFTEKRSPSVCVALPGDWQVTLTLRQAEPNLILAMEGHTVILKDITLKKLMIVLHQQAPHPELVVPLQTFCYHELGWHGALYEKIKNTPSARAETSIKGQPYRTIKENVFPVNLTVRYLSPQEQNLTPQRRKLPAAI